MTSTHDDLDSDYVAGVARRTGYSSDEIAAALVAFMNAADLMAAFTQGGPADTWSEGTAADLCWRCDSAASQSDIGLCMDCRDDLKQETT